MISKQWLFAAGASAVLAFGVAACGDDDSDDSGSSSGGASGLSGTITIDGSSTVQPFAEAAAELFNEENPDVDITVGAAGTSGGFEKFCAGETDISDASREIEPEEEKLCKEGGVTYTEFQVANDGISIVTNPGLAISCLTHRPARASCGPTTRSPTTASWATTPTPASRSPTPRSASTGRAPTRARSTTSPTRSTVRRASAARTTRRPRTTTCSSRASRATTSGLGYFGFSYYEQNADAPEPGLGRRRRRLRRPERRDDPGRLVRAALAAAVHVSVGGGAGEARGRRRSSSTSPTTTTTIAEAALIVPMSDEQAQRDAVHRRAGGRLRPLEGPPADTRAHGGSRHSSGRRGAGGESPRRPPPPLGRGGDPRRCCSSPRAISVLTTILIVVALLKESIPFFQEVGTAFFTDAEWSPLFNDPQFGIRPAAGRHLPDHRDRDPGRGSDRARLGDLPLRVRDPAGAQAGQADPRGAGRGADDRLRLLRAHLHHPDPAPGHPRRSTSRSSTRSRRGWSWAS